MFKHVSLHQLIRRHDIIIYLPDKLQSSNLDKYMSPLTKQSDVVYNIKMVKLLKVII